MSIIEALFENCAEQYASGMTGTLYSSLSDPANVCCKNPRNTSFAKEDLFGSDEIASNRCKGVMKSITPRYKKRISETKEDNQKAN